VAEKQKVNKTKAVREYLKTDPKAKNQEIAEALRKQGIKISPAYVAGIKTMLKKRSLARKAAMPVAAGSAIPGPAPTAAAEKPTRPGDTITLEQIKKVAETVKTIGGFGRLNELLGVIKEVGGLKKFKDLLEAMAVPQAGESKS
jgi:hypothetical protein